MVSSSIQTGCFFISSFKRFRSPPPRPLSFWRAGQHACTSSSAPIPRRSGNKAFTQFFLEKIAGAGQRPAAVRAGRLPGEGRCPRRTAVRVGHVTITSHIQQRASRGSCSPLSCPDSQALPLYDALCLATIIPSRHPIPGQASR